MNYDYLQTGALVRERRAEETCDNAHDRLRYITLQHGICMLPVTGVVAHLEKDRKEMMRLHDAQSLDTQCIWAEGYIACSTGCVVHTNDIKSIFTSEAENPSIDHAVLLQARCL